MKKIIVLSTVLLFSISTYAQTTDSIKAVTKEFIVDKFPSTRAFDLQYETFGSRNFDSKLFGENFQSGKISNESRLRLATNFLVFKSKNYIVTTSLRYKYDHYTLNDVSSTGQYVPVNQQNDLGYQYLSAAGSFTYFSKLFGKPVVYNATLIADGNEDGVQRVKGLVAGAVILKENRYTLITIGLVGLVDHTAISPVLPSFTWKQSFSDSPWSLDLILPQHLLVQRPLFKNGRLSFASELIGDGYYVKPGQSFLPGTYEYSQLEVRSGAMYEQTLGSRFIFTVKGGIANTLLSRLYQKNAAFSDYVYKNTEDGTGYLNFGISFIPFKMRNGPHQ
jgi:hypothetical protein